MGNSTCAFTHAANHLAEKCRVVSICLSSNWDEWTKSRVQKVVSTEWFEPLETLKGNILMYDYEALLADAHRVFLFWDAYCFEIAECVLGRILHLLQSKRYIVVMHDLSDARYDRPEVNSYQHRRFWRDQSFDRAPLRIGNIQSWVAQSIAILDFATRNGIALDSADHSNHTMFDEDMQKRREMANTLGELFDTQAQ